MSTLLRKILLFSLASIIAIFVFVISILWNYSNKLPDYKILKNYKPPVSSKLYSGEGELVSDFSSEKRIFVPYNSIPKTVIYAFLSAEDKNFFSHPGVDAKGIVRAVVNNISNLISSNYQFSQLLEAPSHNSLGLCHSHLYCCAHSRCY